MPIILDNVNQQCISLIEVSWQLSRIEIVILIDARRLNIALIHHVHSDGNLLHKHESSVPNCSGTDPRNSDTCVTHQPDAPYVLLRADTQDTCFHKNEHVVLCCVTRAVLFFTTETYPASFFPFPTEVDAVPDFSGCTTNNVHETSSQHML